ncbi:MAG TPA: hypothetical protein VMS64_38455 [Candidatus Methylomirabilis sp.]|nr:hypothetical protein [Candidatus Methylomirabilis sp.]
MRGLGLLILLGPTLCLAAAPAPVATSGECSAAHAGVTLCLYRSLLPSAGLVASCRGADDCRIGHYYGNPTGAVWLKLPPGMTTFPQPEVFWLTPTLAQVRVGCGPHCSWSYFYEATRRRVSEPRRSVLAADARRLLMAVAEERALVVRQIFSAREVARIERDWAPDLWLGEAITALRFDADGRLSFTWLRGKEHEPVDERVSVPSVPRSSGPRPARLMS